MAIMAKKGPQYLMWYDDNPKLPTLQKIEDAVAAYVNRRKSRPNVVLVNEADVVSCEDVTVRSATHISRNVFWVGREDAPATVLEAT